MGTLCVCVCVCSTTQRFVLKVEQKQQVGYKVFQQRLETGGLRGNSGVFPRVEVSSWVRSYLGAEAASLGHAAK